MAFEDLSAAQSSSTARTRSLLLRYPAALVVGFWVISAVGLSLVTSRVTDWFDMTDEMRYERLAMSIARTGSPLARIHGTSVADLAQLYPLVLAPLFRHGDVAYDLHRAHILGAWLMTSACIPAFLLARRVAGRVWVGWVLAVTSLTIPWLIYSSFLLTENVAYPAFLWAVFAIQCSVSVPSVRADLGAAVAVLIAFLARTEFIALAAVLPIAVFVVELAAASPGPWLRRAAIAVQRSVRSHPLLVVAYGCVLVGATAFVATGGHLLGLSVYGQEVPSTLLPSGLARGALGNVAQFAFGLGFLPFIVGFAWLVANVVAGEKRETRAFACVGSLSFVLVTAEVTKYTVGVGNVIFERYLFYFVPIVLLALVCALLDWKWPRWSLLAPLLLVCLGLALSPQASYTWTGGKINPDTPVSIFYHPLIELAGSKAAMQTGLVALVVALTGVFALAASRSANRKRLAAVVVTAAVALLVSETSYVFVRLFRTTGYSERPLTAQVPPSLDWVDATVGPNADVTIIPYRVSTDFWVNEKYWRDTEFWNKSVVRDAQYPDRSPYEFTGIWFPKLGLAIDPATGKVSISPTPLVVQSVTDSRFQIAGNVQAENPSGRLIDADRPWRVSFLTLDTYDDGWMKPHTPATIRLYPFPGQRRPRIHYLSLQIWAPTDIARRPFSVRSNLDLYRGAASNSRTTYVNAIPVCVPASGNAVVSVTAAGDSTIPGDLSSLEGSLGRRRGSIFLADASVSDDLGRPCRVAHLRPLHP